MEDPIIMYDRFEDTPLAHELCSKGFSIEGEQPVFIRNPEEGFEASVFHMYEGDWLVYCPTEDDQSTHKVVDMDEVEAFIRSKL